MRRPSEHPRSLPRVARMAALLLGVSPGAAGAGAQRAPEVAADGRVTFRILAPNGRAQAAGGNPALRNPFTL
jgi:hypothetical protein